MADDHGTAARRMDFGESVHLPWITDPESSDRRQFAGLSHDFQEGGGLSEVSMSKPFRRGGWELGIQSTFIIRPIPFL